MAFNSNVDDDAPMSDINVTPLVDVMLVLLVVFMITMPVLTHSLMINLPTSSSQVQNQQPENSKIITIAINKSGQYAFGAQSDEIISLDEIKIKFASIATDNPEQIIVLSADKDVSYEYVVKILEAAKDAKLQKIAFNTEMKK